MRSCVVIPTYNEFDNIDDVISRVLEHDDIDVLVVDDSSPDRTGDKVEIWAEKLMVEFHSSLEQRKMDWAVPISLVLLTV